MWMWVLYTMYTYIETYWIRSSIKYTRLTEYNKITWFKSLSVLHFLFYDALLYFQMAGGFEIFEIFITIINNPSISICNHIWQIFGSQLVEIPMRILDENWITGICYIMYGKRGIHRTSAFNRPSTAWQIPRTHEQSLKDYYFAEDVLGR